VAARRRLPMVEVDGATALIDATISTYITVQVLRTDMSNYMEDYMEDYLAYGILPGLGYVALLAANASIYLEKDFGLDALAGALLLWRSSISATLGTSRSPWSVGTHETTS
jgi:hypothetical protein